MAQMLRTSAVQLPASALLSRSRALQVATLVLLAVVAYASTPFNFWVADDYNYIYPKGLDRVISFFDPTVPTRAFYRPLNFVSWAVDYALYGKSPAGWHLSSVVFHIVTTLVVTLIAYRLIKNWWVALVAGGLFALHPAHTETVSWIGGRADLVCGLFYFPAVLFFIIYLQRRAEKHEQALLFYILSFVMALGALLGKEMGVTVPLALLLTGLFMYPLEGWRSQRPGCWLHWSLPYIPFFALVGVYGLMRLYLVVAHIVPNTYVGPSLLSPGGILSSAASNILLIIGLPNSPEVVPTFPTLAKVAIVLAGLGIAVGLARWLGRWGWYSVLWLALTLLPTANLSQLRWLYIPSFGVCLLGALVAQRLLENRQTAEPGAQRSRSFLAYGFPVALMLLWGLGTIYQNVMWYRSGEEARSVLRQIQSYVPGTSQPITIYFAGAPSSYNTVLLFNSGLPSAMHYLYDDRPVTLHEVEQPLPDPVIQAALAIPPQLGPNPLFLGYKNGVVSTYPSFQALMQAGLKKD